MKNVWSSACHDIREATHRLGIGDLFHEIHFLDKYFNRVALKTTMLRLWGFARGITIQTMGDNLFLFQFSDEFERERVFRGSPWLFDNYLLALNAFDGSCPIHQIRFTHSCFWVQLHGVPLYYMTKETGERVGNAIRTVLEVAVPENGIRWGPSLWVRLCLDITKPLPWGRLITFHSLGQMWVLFHYEQLPWFCFHCGVLGHSKKVCVARLRASSLGADYQISMVRGFVRLILFSGGVRLTEIGGWFIFGIANSNGYTGWKVSNGESSCKIRGWWL